MDLRAPLPRTTILHEVPAVLPKRFARFGLEIHREKTRLVPFGRAGRDRDGGPGTFDFLGFTHYRARSSRGSWVIERKTMLKRPRRAIKAAWQWCKAVRHHRIVEQCRVLAAKLRGHYQYCGIRGNYRALALVYRRVVDAWRYWLGRRGSHGRITWEVPGERSRAAFRLPTPGIVHCV